LKTYLKTISREDAKLTKPVPKVYSTRFFQLITSRQFAEAERILERIKQKMHVSDRNRGYFQALYGMLLTMKNTDRYAFLSTVDLNNKKQLKNHRKEFFSHTENRLHDEYDRGYFEAWADYMRILPRIETSMPSTNNKTATKEAEDESKTQEETSEKAPPQEQKESGNNSTSAKVESAEKAAEPRQSQLLEYAEQR